MSNSTGPREKYIRAEKTTRNRDDYKVLLVGAFLALVILFGNATGRMLYEQRWFRDATAQSPFYDVTVNSQVVFDNSITISGDFIKRRCQFDSMSGYILHVMDGEVHRQKIFVNTEPAKLLTGEVDPENIHYTPSDDPIIWGPWLLSLQADSSVNPIGWEVWVAHQCPESLLLQQNLFAEGDWITRVEEGVGKYLTEPQLKAWIKENLE